LQRQSYGLRDAFLDGEHIRELAIIVLAPHMRAVLRAYQLRGYPDPIGGFPYRALDQIHRVQRLADDASVQILPLELERRCPRDHAEIRYFGEGRGDLLGHAVREELLRRVAGHVGERKNRHRNTGGGLGR